MCMSGTIGLFVLESQQPLVNVVFFRCLIGAVCLAVYCWQARLFGKADFSRRNLVLLGIVGLSIVFNWLALFDSYRYTSIGVASTVYHVQPFFVFFLGALLFKEPLSRQRLLWLVVAFAGVPPHIIALTQLLIGVAILWPYARFDSLPAAPAQWGCLFVLGAVHSAAMYILLCSAYQKLDTSRIAIIAYIYPLVAILVDYVYFGRSLSLVQIAGGVLVLSAGLCSTLNVNLRGVFPLRAPQI
jgi:drug/metabolite transporter (DMT)-like permease